ncbi:SAM-dependent methyltransferase [Oerskovia sp. M15]
MRRPGLHRRPAAPRCTHRRGGRRRARPARPRPARGPAGRRARGFNVRDLAPSDLDATPDVVVADLSFISLRLVLPPVAAVVGPRTDLLLMVKPQFEVGRERLGTGEWSATRPCTHGPSSTWPSTPHASG